MTNSQVAWTSDIITVSTTRICISRVIKLRRRANLRQHKHKLVEKVSRRENIQLYLLYMYKTLYTERDFCSSLWLRFTCKIETSLMLSKREAGICVVIVYIVTRAGTCHLFFETSLLIYRILWKCYSLQSLSSSRMFSRLSRMFPVICRISTLFFRSVTGSCISSLTTF